MKNNLVATSILLLLLISLFAIAFEITTVTLGNPAESQKTGWKLVEIENPTSGNVTGDFEISVSPSRVGVHIAGSTDITYYFVWPYPGYWVEQGYLTWWDWLNGTAPLAHHWDWMDWWTTVGSLTNITYDEIKHWTNPDMYADSGDVPYKTFMDNTYMADPNLTDVHNDPDIYPDLLPWVDNKALLENQTIPANMTVWLVLKIVMTESGVYTFNMTGPLGITITPSSWRMGGLATIVVPDEYSTIQAAINAASTGDTIIVHPGTYPESVTVTKNNLTIKALYRATAEGAPGNVIVSPASGNGFTVRADGVTIDGFEITTGSGDGIYFEGSNNIFQYNIIHDINTGGTGGGICCWDLDGGSNDNQILCNTIYNCTADAILYGASNVNGLCNWHGTISNNTVWNLATQDGWNPSIEVVNGQNFTISSNTVTGRSVQYYGIFLYSWNGAIQSDHIISDNMVTSHYTGICAIADTNGGVYQGLGSVATANFNNLTFTGNNASGANYHGIQLRAIPNAGTASVTNCTISNSVFCNDGFDGINLLDSNVNDIKILGNHIYGNGRDGIRLYANSGVIINYNNIYSNSGCGVNKTSAPTVDGRFNWWGNETGPYHNVTNPAGTGDAVSDNVLFKPWLVEPYPPAVFVSVLYVDPPLIQYWTPSYGSNFTINVKLANVSLLYGFQFNLTWNNSLLILVDVEYFVLWSEYFEVRNETSAGVYSVATTCMGEAFPFNGSATLATLTFKTVYDPIYPENVTSSLALVDTLLGRSKDMTGAEPIPHLVYDGQYFCYSKQPKIAVSPHLCEVWKHQALTTFNVGVNITDVVNLYAYEIELRYNTSLLDATKINIEPFFTSYRNPISLINDTQGLLIVRVEATSPAPPANGSGMLVTFTFQVTKSTVWDTSGPTLSSGLSLTVKELVTDKMVPIQAEIINGLYRYNPVPGDLNKDGEVDMADLRITAQAFDKRQGQTGWDPRADLNRDGIVNILDIIIVARNFGRAKP